MWQRGDLHGRKGMCSREAGACAAGGGCAWQGACVAGQTATAARGTHPTGMHSCLSFFVP